MSNKLSIKEAVWKNGNYHLTCHDIEMDIDRLTPARRVLVDSDELAFIYILETPEQYIYLPLPIEYWSNLKKVVAEHSRVLMTINHKEIELEELVDELQYVISNIEGNANYGDKLVEEVEAVFIK